MPIPSPSRTQPTAIPIFALKWYSHPSILPSHILAYAGGGGSAKTGIGNTVNIQITSDSAESYHNESIIIDTGVEIAVALDIVVQPDSSTSGVSPLIYMAVGIGHFVKVYWINFIDCEATEIGSLAFENSSGVNSVSWNSTGDKLVAGCENGTVCIVSAKFGNQSEVSLRQIMALTGHLRAVCCCVFHPRNPYVLMSSAKDGTCRIWNLGKVELNNDIDNNEDKCVEELQCRIYDPKGPKPKAANILNPKPGQCLVRGCAFGDLDGRILYTVQSGRKGGAFLSVWKLIRRACSPTAGEEQVDGQQQQQQQQQGPKFVFEFKETMRKQVSNFPVSAMSLSGDYTTLALGDTNGCITLLSTDTFHKIKFWECAHDLPVTCIAARPLPLQL
jgi:WD40 repeat protein